MCESLSETDISLYFHVEYKLKTLPEEDDADTLKARPLGNGCISPTEESL